MAVTSNCSCGFQLAHYNNAYFPSGFEVDFTAHSSIDSLASLGLEITDWQIGIANPKDGTTAVGSYDNIRFLPNNQGIGMLVPGGQKQGAPVTGAEIAFPGDGDGMTSLVTEVQLMLDDVPGTCQAVVSGAVGKSQVGESRYRKPDFLSLSSE